MTTTIYSTPDNLSGELGVGGVPKMRFGADTSGQPFSFRNKIINGDFSIAQRGTSITNATSSWVYSLDRWRFYGQSTTGSATVSQQAFTIGQTDVPDEPTYFIRWNQTVAPASNVYLTQPIENVRTFAGQTCTVSFWAKAASATTAFCYLTQYFGSGGSGDVSTATQTLSLTTTWQKFTKTFTLSSISGKTLGAGHFLDLQFGAGAASTFTIDIAQVQVESGSIATPFENRPIQVELAMCQRYYQQVRVYLGGYNGNGANILYYSPLVYPPMRTVVNGALITEYTASNLAASGRALAGLTVNSAYASCQALATGSYTCDRTYALEAEL